jgi:hypothetical protein
MTFINMLFSDFFNYSDPAFYVLQLKSIHNVDILWTEYLKGGILHAVLVQNDAQM